ncbi:hypothetical protein SAMIE_1006490 [Sphingobium amiense]|uniref:PDZ domain-containing protein n=2 Tax=Sphingobium amiense TaxID=135719 RepID=A0A494W1U2_9SPHN|nr:hypothetical protein SAMIE_1006490 [Sphingobium amiense]
MLLAAIPLILSMRYPRSPAAAVVVSDAMGLTLGEYAGRRVVVTSLRSRGPADRSGIRVGDLLDAVASRRVSGLIEAQRLIQNRLPCGETLHLHHGPIPYEARIWQCRTPGEGRSRHVAAGQERKGDGTKDIAGRG